VLKISHCAKPQNHSENVYPMIKNNLFKTLLVLQTMGLLAYTIVAYQREGANLLSVFITNVTSLNWSGQFNLDFLCYLTLSGLWIMWRNKFTGKSILVGILAMVLGIVLFAPYLFWLTNQENGDLKRVFIGDR
jgi:hypothetical protein